MSIPITFEAVARDGAKRADFAKLPLHHPSSVHTAALLLNAFPLPSDLLVQPNWRMDAKGNLFKAVYNHLVLPPRLPERQDAKLTQIGHEMLDRLASATRFLAFLPDNPFSREHKILFQCLRSCRIVNEGGKLDTTSLLAAFRNLECNHVLILHITEQNTGLLIRREHR